MEFEIFHLRCRRKFKKKLEIAVDGVPSQIPTLKFLTPLQHPQVSSLGHDPGDRISFISSISENAHKIWYKKSLR